MKIRRLILAVLLLPVAGTAVAQQSTVQAASTTTPTPVTANPETAETVVIESTITGNQEQPKTIYVLPWQDSVARIKMPAAEPPITPQATQPLDREQFLRFIQAQPALSAPKGDSEPESNHQSLNN